MRRLGDSAGRLCNRRVLAAKYTAAKFSGRFTGQQREALATPSSRNTSQLPKIKLLDYRCEAKAKFQWVVQAIARDFEEIIEVDPGRYLSSVLVYPGVIYRIHKSVKKLSLQTAVRMALATNPPRFWSGSTGRRTSAVGRFVACNAEAWL